MIKANRTEYVERDSLLKLLSDEEIARVSTAETRVGLAPGDEYIDLEQIEQGEQMAPGATSMGRVLPRKAVDESTWQSVLAELERAKVAFKKQSDVANRSDGSKQSNGAVKRAGAATKPDHGPR